MLHDSNNKSGFVGIEIFIVSPPWSFLKVIIFNYVFSTKMTCGIYATQTKTYSYRIESFLRFLRQTFNRYCRASGMPLFFMNTPF